MDFVVGDLPLHILIVHLTVVGIPAAALCVALSALWPAARRRLGLATPVLALIMLALVPVTTAAGEWLAARVGQTELLARHEALGATLLPWAIALAAVAIAQWCWFRFRAPAAADGARLTSSRAITVILAVLALGGAMGAVWTIVAIGESGAAAVWQGSFDL